MTNNTLLDSIYLLLRPLPNKLADNIAPTQIYVYSFDEQKQKAITKLPY